MPGTVNSVRIDTISDERPKWLTEDAPGGVGGANGSVSKLPDYTSFGLNKQLNPSPLSAPSSRISIAIQDAEEPSDPAKTSCSQTQAVKIT